MMLLSRYDAARKNLSDTYFALARKVQGCSVENRDGFDAVTSSFQHPIGNFAVCSDKAPIDGKALRALAINRPYFNVYVPSPKTDPGIDPRLTAEGFVRVYVLWQLAATGVQGDGGMSEATTGTMRHRIAAFMAQQFFGMQTAEVQVSIAGATASATDLALFASTQDEFNQGIVAGVMLNESEDVLGLYNLCVASEKRRSGYGSALVRKVLARAHSRNVPVVLQCDAKLAGWYNRFGFDPVGSVAVYGVR